MRKWLVGLLAASVCAASSWAVTDTLTAGDLGATSTTYKDFSGVQKTSDAVYAGNSAKASSGAIQLRSKDGAGIVTTASGGTATKVTLSWADGNTEGRTVDVYGKTEAYSASTDLYNSGTQGTKLGSIALGSTDLEIEGEYTFIGLRSNNGALYLNSVAIDWDGEPTPVEFGIALDPAEDFEVVQGREASIAATVKGAQGDVTYSWSVDGTPIELEGNVYTIDSAEVGGPYEVACEASDGVSDPVSASVSYSVVEAPVVSGDVLTRETTGVTGNSYTDWTATGDSGTKYAGNSAGGNTSIQLNTGSPKGIVITESAGSDVASVTVEWNDATAEKRSLEIYGSADAYAGPADLYGDAKGELLGTIARDGATLEIPEGYPYVGVLAKGGAVYLTSVAFEFAGEAGLSVTLDKANGFTVDLNTADSITAAAKNGVEPYTYVWRSDTPDLNGTGETLNIPDTLAEGDYTVQVEVTDAESNKANKQIYFSVVAPAVKYDVVVADGILNGVVEVDKAQAEADETVTVTATPEAGYRLVEIIVNNGEVAVSGNTFVMPAGDALVTATFELKPVVAGDVLTNDDVGGANTSYIDWTATKDSGAEYAGQSAGGPTTNPCIQLRSKNNNSGIVMTKGSGQNVAEVIIEWNAQSADGRVVQVYGSTTAYTAPSDLYGDNAGTLLGAVTNGSDVMSVDVAAAGEYPYIGVRSKSDALYLTSVTVLFDGSPAAFSIALDPAEDFEVKVGEEAEITATVRGAQGDVTYSWSVNGTPIDLAGGVYAIDSAAVGGPYEVTCQASDGVSDPVSASVSYSVVEAPVVTGDVLTRDSTGVTGTQYKDWTYTGESGTKYAGNSAGGNTSIQLNTGSPKGIVITESAGSDVTSVTVEWNDATADTRSIQIYGSTSAYAGPADLYGDGKGELLGEIAKGETTLEIPAGYPYIGILAKGGALYLTSVAFEFGGATAFSIALDPAEDFEVKVGEEAEITATVRGAQGDVTYSWSVNGTPIDLAGGVYAIDSAAVGGPYEVTCQASDGVSDPVSASVTYSVVEAPPVTGDEFTLIDSVDGLADGVRVVLTDPDGGYALSSTVASSVFGATAVAPVADVITTEDATIIWTLKDDGSGNFSLYNEGAAKYAGHSGGASSNSGRLQDEPFPNAITVAEGGLFVLTATTADSSEFNRTLQYNYNGGSPRFAYYKATQKNLRIYAAQTGPVAFSIALDPAEDFEVKVGEEAAITATVRGAQGDVTYSWSVNGTPIDLAGGVYAIDSAEVGGPYEVTCQASDGVSEPVSASVTYSVVEAPPVTGDEFKLIDSVDALEDGAEYVITDNSKAFAMKAELSSGSTTRLVNEPVAPENDVITTEDALLVWKLVEDGDGNFAFYNESVGKYIGWSSGNSAKFQNDAFANTISYEDNLFVVTATSTVGTDAPRKLQFNSATNSMQFAYYTGTQKNLNFFKKESSTEPKITFTGDTTVQLPDGAFRLAFTLANYDGDFEWVVDSREGGAIDQDGVYTWAPSEAGEVTIKVVARNGELDIASKTVDLTVEAAPGPQPGDPAIEFGGDTTGVVGSPVNFTVTPVDFPVGVEVEVFFEDGEFPEGSEIDPEFGDNYATVSFVPDVVGTYTFVFSAEGGEAVAGGTLEIVVTDGPGPQPASFKITGITKTGDNLVLTFEGEGEAAVYGTATLNPQDWTVIEGAEISGTTVTVPMGDQKFIRIDAR